MHPEGGIVFGERFVPYKDLKYLKINQHTEIILKVHILTSPFVVA